MSFSSEDHVLTQLIDSHPFAASAVLAANLA